MKNYVGKRSQIIFFSLSYLNVGFKSSRSYNFRKGPQGTTHVQITPLNDRIFKFPYKRYPLVYCLVEVQPKS